MPSLYVHVPFCVRKCAYCDFYSVAGASRDHMERYVDGVLAELDVWIDSQAAVRPRWLYMGGGTPTVLPPDTMHRLVEGLRDRLDMSALEEWTVECNPATADGDHLAMLRRYGVNRLSIGAQSFDAAQLSLLGRSHSPLDISRTVAAAREAGLANLGLDLIYAIPGQTIDSWTDNLQAAVSLAPVHLSCYALTLESGTPLHRAAKSGAVRPCPERLELEMFRQTRRLLSSRGYTAYEISNYAAPGAECLHNLNCWRGGNYAGIGPTAASHVDGTRWRNVRDLTRWQQAVGRGEMPAEDFETLTPLQRAREMIMLGLRLAEGVDLRAVREKTGIHIMERWREMCGRLVARGVLEVGADRIRLTEAGTPLADAIAAEFFD